MTTPKATIIIVHRCAVFAPEVVQQPGHNGKRHGRYRRMYTLKRVGDCELRKVKP